MQDNHWRIQGCGRPSGYTQELNHVQTIQEQLLREFPQAKLESQMPGSRATKGRLVEGARTSNAPPVRNSQRVVHRQGWSNWSTCRHSVWPSLTKMVRNMYNSNLHLYALHAPRPLRLVNQLRHKQRQTIWNECCACQLLVLNHKPPTVVVTIAHG